MHSIPQKKCSENPTSEMIVKIPTRENPNQPAVLDILPRLLPFDTWTLGTCEVDSICTAFERWKEN